MEKIEWQNVKNFDNYKINRFGQVVNIKRNKILKNDETNGRGY